MITKDYPFNILLEEKSGLHCPHIMSMEVEFLEIVYHMGVALRLKNILEIGTYRSQSTWWLSKIAQMTDGYVTSVDPAPTIMMDLPNTGYVREFSDDFFARNTQKFDLILIDGDHSYAACDKDIKNSKKALSPGGVIVVHDTVLGKDTVGRAIIDNTFEEWTHFPFGRGMSYVRI